jgi:hypothetical protein
VDPEEAGLATSSTDGVDDKSAANRVVPEQGADVDVRHLLGWQVAGDLERIELLGARHTTLG